jgi:ABC-type lipoprotein export system ATPase subunit
MLLGLENVFCRFGAQKVLGPLNVSIGEGQHTLFLGPSGSGKTTVLNLMAGLLRASTGEVLFDAQRYSVLGESALDALRARNFGFVFQRLHLLPFLSVANNVALAQKTHDAIRIKTLLEDVGLGERLQQKARDLSVGEAQRVAIARALVHRPRVIFADEPTSALDDANTRKIMELLSAQAQKTGATLVVSTHDARIQSHFSHVIEMTL